MRAIKSFDTIFLCLHVFKFHKFLSQNKRPRISYHNESNQKFWHHTFCVFMSLLSFDFSWSFSKKNLRKSLVAFWYKVLLQSSLIELIISDFSWSFSKKLEEIFICILMPRLWYNIFFLHWFCLWLFMTNLLKNLVVICTGCTKLQEAIYVISMQSEQIFYSLHGFCSWFFMNP